ncbi:helix-turn-helix domain-containing protein [Aerococcaceae bacterium zg-B36]|uniref:LexA family protein n=1 Tax=Aerococcaceae bacterium zg-252 TaxID=2796928 RepID=UPI001BD90FCA|nr:helix-turn-helix domain-containing protein [Aerococcaceae bacterium zg-B36]
MDFATRLEQLKSETGYNNVKIADIAGVRRSTVTGWFKGQYKPTIKTLETLAEFFDVSVGWLLGYDTPQTYDIQPTPTIDLPYLGTVSAGGFEYATEANDVMPIPSHLIKEDLHDYFILKTNGDSMNREIANGHYVIVQDIRNGTYQIKNRDILIFKNGSEYTMKRVKKTETMIYLEPDSYLDGFETQSFVVGGDHELEIIGKVIYSFKEF